MCTCSAPRCCSRPPACRSPPPTRAFSEPLLLLLGQSPEIAGAAAEFAYGLVPQIFAFAANCPIQKFLQAQSIVAPSAYILAASLALHVALSWLSTYVLGLGLLWASFTLCPDLCCGGQPATSCGAHGAGTRGLGSRGPPSPTCRGLPACPSRRR
jgi:hypothetical protein